LKAGHGIHGIDSPTKEGRDAQKIYSPGRYWRSRALRWLLHGIKHQHGKYNDNDQHNRLSHDSQFSQQRDRTGKH